MPTASVGMAPTAADGPRRVDAAAKRFQRATLASEALGGGGIGSVWDETRGGGAGNCSAAGIGDWAYGGKPDGVGIGGGTIVR